MYMLDFCTVSANLAGLPAISIPCGLDVDRMPIGLQIITNRFNEQTMFDLAYALQQELKLNIKPEIIGDV